MSEANPSPASAEARLPLALRGAAALGWRALVLAVAVGVVVFVLIEVWFASIALVVALFVASVLDPVSTWLRRRMRDSLAALITLGGAVAIVAGVIAFVVPSIYGQFSNIRASTGTAANAGTMFGLPSLQAGIDLFINEYIPSIDRVVLSGAFMSLEGLLLVVLTLVLLFLLLKDGDRIGHWLVGLFPEHQQEKAEGAGQRAWQTLSSYLRGSAGVGLVEAVIIGIGLWALGMPLVLPLAVLVFIGAFFPIIGILTAGGISAFIAIGSLGLGNALIVLALFLVVHLLEANVLYPVIAGQSLNLHPFAVMLVVAAASTVAGPIGAFLSIPLAAMTYAIGSYLKDEARTDGATQDERRPSSEEQRGARPRGKARSAVAA